MKYIANQDIGDFKVGDEVPAEQAVVWNEMYVNPVCDVEKEAKPEPVKEVAKKSVKKVAKKAAKKSLFKKK